MDGRIIRLEKNLRVSLSGAKNPILCWSGGKDSTFLLMLMHKMGYDKIPVLVFPHFWSRKQKTYLTSMVNKLKLTAYFYSPVSLRYTPPYIQADYVLGNRVVPIVMDHIAGDGCGLDVGINALKDSALQPGYTWDLTIIGTKESDTHPLVKKFDLENFISEGYDVIAPLWDWTDGEVLGGCRKLGFELDERVYTDGDDTADTGHFISCMACIGAKKRVYCPKVKSMINGTAAVVNTYEI